MLVGRLGNCFTVSPANSFENRLLALLLNRHEQVLNFNDYAGMGE
jgi:hypothetical protein